MRKRKIERERFASFSSGILFVVSCCSCKSCSCRLTHKSFIFNGADRISGMEIGRLGFDDCRVD